MKQLHPDTILAMNAKRLGALPASVALASADIGTAELLDGSTVYITWGRNLDRWQQQRFISETGFVPVWISAHDGSAELILPDEMIAPLLPLLK